MLVTTPLNAELASARKLEFRVGRARIGLFKERGISASSVALKVWAWAWAQEADQAWLGGGTLEWVLEPKLPGRGVKPAVAGLGPDGSVLVWIATQALHPEDLVQVLKQKQLQHLVVVESPPVPEEDGPNWGRQALEAAMAPSVQWHRKHVHFRYATGRLTLVRVAPLESWLDPQAVEVSAEQHAVHRF